MTMNYLLDEMPQNGQVVGLLLETGNQVTSAEYISSDGIFHVSPSEFYFDFEVVQWTSK